MAKHNSWHPLISTSDLKWPPCIIVFFPWAHFQESFSCSLERSEQHGFNPVDSSVSLTQMNINLGLFLESSQKMSSAILHCNLHELPTPLLFSSRHLPLIRRGGYTSGVKIPTPDSTMNSESFHSWMHALAFLSHSVVFAEIKMPNLQHFLLCKPLIKNTLI